MVNKDTKNKDGGADVRVFWISANDLDKGGSGGATYSRALLDLFRSARPDWDLVVMTPPDRARPATPGQHRFRQSTCLLASLIGGAPARVRFSAYPALADRIAAATAAGAPNLAILDGADMRENAMPLLSKGIPYLTVVHNIEHRLFTANLARLSAPLQTAFRLIGEPDRYARYERRTWEGSAGFVHVSIDEMAEMPVNRPAILVPPVFEGPALVEVLRPPGPLRLGYLGKLTWWPNQAGLEWFLHEIWPMVGGDTELHLWGLGSEAYGDGDARIHGHGFAPDLAEVWRRSDVMVIPVTAGGGVNIKLCEALYRGKPCLATPLALRGLPSIEDPALKVAKTPVDWKKALLKDPLAGLSRRVPQPETRALFGSAHTRLRLSAWLVELGF